MNPRLQSVMAKLENADLSLFDRAELTGPNVKGKVSGETPLHVIAIWGDIEAGQILIGEGAEIDARGEHGFTPLHEAVQQEQIEMVKLLIRNGANPLVKSDLGDAFELASYSGNPELIRILKEKEA